MISSFRNFAKTKFAGLLVFIMIIPFVFWGMGSIFSGGNSNVVAKIDKINISTQDFINHINSTNIPETTIRENLDNKIIEELLSTLVSLTILNLEIEDMNIIISEKTLSNKIKSNQMFLDENNEFQRTKYEKFLLENNITASFFEMRLKNQELQKKLFDYMGAGIVVPNFLVKKLYKEENKRLELKYINLQEFYKKKEEFDNVQIEKFVKENKDQLKIEYLDFDYIIINPKILTGVDEFNQAFFDKIDQIEIDISNEINVKTIAKNFNIKPQSVTNFRLSSDANEIEKKIFESKNIRIDIIENKNDYILYQINKSEEKDPDLNDEDLKNELIGLIYEKNKFDYNQKLLKKIDDNIFTENDFLTMGKDRIKKMILNSFNDNEKFDANSVKLLYSLPSDSYTLVADKKNNIYLIKIEKEDYKDANMDNKIFNEYLNKQKSESRSSILKTYDLLLNEKYNVELNEKTIDRVKNFFQ